MTYDYWKATDPADEWLGPDPDWEPEDEPEIEDAIENLRSPLDE